MNISVIVQITPQLAMFAVATGWLWMQDFGKNQQKHPT